MRLTVIGCSGSFPGPDSAASCYLVEAEGFRLLLDMGSGGLSALQRHARLDQIDAVCVSHLHSDHCVDLCGFSVARIIHPGGPMPQIPVYGPDQTQLRLARALDADPASGADAVTGHDSRFTDAFSYVTISPGVVDIGPLRVTAAPMSHPVQTFGFRIEHAGRSVAYSADTGETGELVQLASDADILLCEASFLEPAPGSPPLPQGLHLTARQAAQHAERARAGRLVLTHLVPWNDRDRSLEEASAAFGGPVSVASSGLVLALE